MKSKGKTLLDFHSFRANDNNNIQEKESNVTSSIIIETQHVKHVILKLSSFFFLEDEINVKARRMSSWLLLFTLLIQTTSRVRANERERLCECRESRKVKKKIGVERKCETGKRVYCSLRVCYVIFFLLQF